MPCVPACLAVLLALSSVSPAVALDDADRLWLVGERSFADGLYPVSRRALEKFVAQYPKDARVSEAMLLLGKARLRAGDADAALEAFRKAQTLSPPPGRPQESRFWEGEALFRLKRFAEARGAYDAVVKNDAASPFAGDAVYGRAWSDLEMHLPAAAIAGFREFLQTWPDHPQAASATLQLGRVLADEKKPAEALAVLQPFAAKYPGSKLLPDAQYLLGWAKTNAGDKRGGVADLRAFVAANPSHAQAPAARKIIAQAMGATGDREEMLEAYKLLMDQEPASADALYNAVQIATRLGRPKDQEAAFKRLSSEFPNDALTRRAALDRANTAFKGKSWAAAVSLAQQAAKSDDAAVKSEALLLVGESELKQKHWASAAKAFEGIKTLGDVDAGVRYRAMAGLGLAREEQQDWKAALAAYESVVSRSPDATLRDWARERATAMKTRMAQPSAPSAPPQKPAPKKEGKS
ncbi:MAG TPA: tetratricopeptide repeat protein [Methylomirabilota bacterium]|nr:tetratricopeptide repeat protein [Methylomirabilota bacterium]